jgi:Cu/Ag efflux protein CusF
MSLLPIRKRARRGTRKRETPMRSFVGALAGLLLFTACAFAGEAEGHIKKIDRDNMTITLDNGKSYKLPGETDMDGIKEGMDVVLAYDKVNGENLITDIQLPE